MFGASQRAGSPLPKQPPISRGGCGKGRGRQFTSMTNDPSYGSSLPSQGGFGRTPSTRFPNVPTNSSYGVKCPSPSVYADPSTGRSPVRYYSGGRSTIGMKGSLSGAIGLIAVACLVTGVILLVMGAIPNPFIDLELVLIGVSLMVIAPVSLPLICSLICYKACCL